MPNYKNGKIYKVFSPQSEEIYIGSTTIPLNQRFYVHKSSRSCRSKYLFENYDDVKIALIEEYPCNNEKELTKKEGEHVKSNKCLNKNVPGRTAKEWYRDEAYYENNKEKLNKKFNCECGGKHTFQNKLTHFKTNKHIAFTNSHQ